MARRLTDEERVFRSIPEATVITNALAYLAMRGVYAWRNNSGGFTDKNGQFVRFGKPGSADILGVGPDGRFWAVEAKREREQPRPDQQQFLDDVAQRGGVAIVIRPSTYTAEIDRALDSTARTRPSDTAETLITVLNLEAQG